jgi:predicted DNA-binding antitoxin AbrB/MazE fold protein
MLPGRPSGYTVDQLDSLDNRASGAWLAVRGKAMKSIHAVYENGVFRPTEPVELPEGTAVVVAADELGVAPAQAARDRVYENLSRSYLGGEPDESERHNEHQP